MNPLFNMALIIFGLFVLAAAPPVGVLFLAIALGGHLVRRGRINGHRAQMQRRSDERWREDYYNALRSLHL